MKKKKFLTYILLSTFICVAIVLCGCSETNTKTTLNSIMGNLNRVSTTLNNVQDLDQNDLIITDFMDEKELNFIDTGINSSLVKNEAMQTYFTKIANLNNNVISTIEVNDTINSYKLKIFARVSNIKAVCSQLIDNHKEIEKNTLNSLNELNNNISANTTRIGLSRNEITNNYNNMCKIKQEYSTKPDQLNTRYTKLKTSLNTRLSYYKNLLTSLDNLSNIMCDDFKPICDDYYPNEEELINHDNNKSLKTGLHKNIDTYENAGTNIYGDYRNNPMYNPDNYLKNYNPGYGMNGPQIGGFGMNGFSGAYGYGMYPNGYRINGYNGMYGYGMPYGGRYLYPNINTFGTYKNIDTYKSKKNLNEEYKQEDISNNEDDLISKENCENEPLKPNKSIMPPTPQPTPMPYNNNKDINNTFAKDLSDDENEEHFVDNQNQPNVNQCDRNI